MDERYAKLQQFLENSDIPLISLEIVEVLSHLEDPQEGVELEIKESHRSGVRYIAWYKDGKIHRDGDRPARIYPGGTREWFKNGKPHRAGDKPAVITSCGARRWFKNGKPHRAGDKPAVIDDKVQQWFKNGELHRDGGKPAAIWNNGRKTWWVRGKKVMTK